MTVQSFVLAVSLLLVVLVAITFWWAVRNSAAVPDTTEVAGRAERLRSGLFWNLVLLGLLVALLTLLPWPHDAATSQGTVVVTATGNQWSWELSQKDVPLGRPVVFRVTSRDVNHGFGVYDPEGTLLFQTQAMPGYINQVRYTFTKPGRYRVLCLEYCGLVHHDMTANLRVVAN
jgi:cytochrome c oxidase subunit 2